MCGSSQQAIHFAAQAVAAGDMDFAIGAGVESMTRVPMFSDIACGRGNVGFEVLNPDLFVHHELIHQGESAERIAERWSISREEADRFAMESHRRASEAAKRGLHSELLPTAGLDREGNPFALQRDEGIRDLLDEAKMKTLPTVFRPDGNGVVTAGNSSQT